MCILHKKLRQQLLFASFLSPLHLALCILNIQSSSSSSHTTRTTSMILLVNAAVCDADCKQLTISNTIYLIGSTWQTPQSIFRCRSSSTSSHRSYRRHIPKMSASPCRVTRTRQPETAVQVISWNQPSSFHHRLNQKCLEANGIFCRVRFVERLLIGRVCWSDTWERIQVRYTFPRWGLLRCF